MASDGRLHFGEVTWCPTCKGEGKIKRDPKKPKVVCGVCTGSGLVENKGPIAVNKKVLR